MAIARFLTTLVAAVSLLPSGALLAQEHAHPDEAGAESVPRMQCTMMSARTEGGPAMMEMAGMMAMMGPAPATILEQKEALELSDQQIQLLEGMSVDLAEQRDEHMTNMRPLHKRFMMALQADDTDLALMEKLLEEMSDQHIQVHMAMLRVGQEAMEVLSAEQRANVRYGMRLMHARMGKPQGMGDMPQTKMNMIGTD